MDTAESTHIQQNVVVNGDIVTFLQNQDSITNKLAIFLGSEVSQQDGKALEISFDQDITELTVKYDPASGNFIIIN